MKTQVQQLTLKSLARLYGATMGDLPEICKKMVAEGKFKYRMTSPKEHENIILDILKRIDSPNHTLAGPQGKLRWKNGWKENLRDFISTNYNLATLIPKYYHSFQAIRLDGKYVIPLKSNFEVNYITAFFSWIFSKYLKNVDSIYEFGCGTGFNLILLAQMFPEKKMYGLDWVLSSKKILNLLAKKVGLPIKGQIFNMLKPDYSFQITKNSAIVNIASLEQLGKNFKPFVNFVIKNFPAIVLDINHINELYNPNILFDYLALKFEHRRGYLDGYLTYLRQLESRGKIKIIKIHHSHLGTLTHDGFSYIIWKPLH